MVRGTVGIGVGVGAEKGGDDFVADASVGACVEQGGGLLGRIC